MVPQIDLKGKLVTISALILAYGWSCKRLQAEARGKYLRPRKQSGENILGAGGWGFRFRALGLGLSDYKVREMALHSRKLT